MYLNVTGCGGGGPTDTPKTPEILNSIMSLTSPPLPPTYQHYQTGATDLLSPDGSTPGDEYGGGNCWTSGTCIDGNGSSQQQLSSPTVSRSINIPQIHTPTSTTLLLTPTSDESPPPPGLSGTAPPGCLSNASALELPSPVSTVEATRSALIKEGLKLQITSKLQQSGAEACVLHSESKVVKNELTQEDEEKRRKRRERNKLAATKCRNKKKEMTCILISESETVEELNVRLKGEVEKLMAEKEKLQKSLNDARHKANCKHVRSKTSSSSCSRSSPVAEHTLQNPEPCSSISPHHHNYTIPSCASPSTLTCASSTLPSYVSPLSYASPSSTSPSYCSSVSPCSFTALLSPSDNKDFIATLTNNNPCSLSDANSTTMTGSSTGNSLTPVSTSTNIEYLETTIPLATSGSTTTAPSKIVTSKCKPSQRYHPYTYPPNPATTVSASVSFTNDVSSYSENVIPESIHDSRAYCPAGTSYSYTTLDIKTNPFTYPTINDYSSQHPDDQRSRYGSFKTPRNVDTATLARFSPYTLNSNVATDTNVSDVAGCSVQHQSCNDGLVGSGLSNGPDYYGACTYSTL